jgi:hypothetical protein
MIVNIYPEVSLKFFSIAVLNLIIETYIIYMSLFVIDAFFLKKKIYFGFLFKIYFIIMYNNV